MVSEIYSVGAKHRSSAKIQRWVVFVPLLQFSPIYSQLFNIIYSSIIHYIDKYITSGQFGLLKIKKKKNENEIEPKEKCYRHLKFIPFQTQNN